VKATGPQGLSKEPIYDTEGWAAAVPQPAQITTFVNFSGFNTAGLALAKSFGRDTNLQGQNGQIGRVTA